MSWRVIAAVLIFVLTMIVFQPLLGPALTQVTESLNETGDYDDRYLDGNSVFGDLQQTLLRAVSFAVMGVLAWGAVRVVRKERFRGRR